MSQNRGESFHRSIGLVSECIRPTFRYRRFAEHLPSGRYGLRNLRKIPLEESLVSICSTTGRRVKEVLLYAKSGA